MTSLAPAPTINSCSTTDVTSITTSHTWTINNFSSIAKKTMLTSPSWTSFTNKYGEITWNLQLHPYGDSNSTENSIALYLQATCEKKDIEAHFTFAVLVGNRKKNVITAVNDFIPNDWGVANFLRKGDQYKSFLPQDNLTIYCEVRVMNDIINSSIQTTNTNRTTVEVPDCRLSQDWDILFENKKLSDVTLSVKGQVFKTHKLVLAARSAVFSAMFDHEMAENINNCVNITDVKPEVIREMLRFIYTGTTGNIDGMAGELLAAADKYALDRLKNMCEQVLCLDLSMDSVVASLVLADLHSASQLKAQAIEYIVNHVKELVDTEAFKSVSNTHPHLILEVLRLAIGETSLPEKKIIMAFPAA